MLLPPKSTKNRVLSHNEESFDAIMSKITKKQNFLNKLRVESEILEAALSMPSKNSQINVLEKEISKLDNNW